MTHERRLPLGALERIALEMTSVLDLNTLLGTIADGLIEELDAAFARIWLVDRTEPCAVCNPPETCTHRVRQLRLRASSGLSTRLDGRYGVVAMGAHKIGMIAQTGEPVCSHEIESDPRVADRSWVRENKLISFAGYPLRFRGQLLGVLALFSRQKLTDDDFDKIGLFAHQASIAIQNAQLYSELDSLAAKLRAENSYLHAEIQNEHDLAAIVGESEALRRVMEQIEQVAPTDATVLISGETGTGKELFARAIHDRSLRRSGPMVKLNCAAMAPTLIESELFGHEKGAFTGATARRTGRFELAHGGTLFLDEVGELSLDAQTKLLRVLEESEFERVGGTSSVKVNVRVVAATNRVLRELIDAGRFRADLFYRLSVFPIEAPPLRERMEDVPLLARAFITRSNQRIRKSVREIAPDALALLGQYQWPGNIRELRNVIERAVILAPGLQIDRKHLPDLQPRATSKPIVAPVHPDLPVIENAHNLREIERNHITRVLHETDWVIEGASGAAGKLGLRPSTLRSRMEKLAIRRVGKP